MRTKNMHQNPNLDEAELRRILEAAGPRPEVPAAELASIKSAAREDWRRLVDRSPAPPAAGGRAGWRIAVPLALAATLLVALSVGWWWRGLQAPSGGPVVATVERAAGIVLADGSPVLAGAALGRGVEVATEAGDEPPVVALRLAGGQSVRLDAGSRVRFVDGATIELERGAVYVDSNGDGGSVEVRTALGNVRDVGTQFEVRLAAEAANLRVRVRQGSVEVDRRGESRSAVAGEQLTIGADGSVDRRSVAPWDEDWGWVIAAAPALEIEGLPLTDYLAWLSRETGLRVRFQDDALAASATQAILHGSIRDLTPDESLHVVIPGSNFEYRLEDGLLLIQP